MARARASGKPAGPSPNKAGGPSLRQRLDEALQLLGTNAADADALARADALWLARVLPQRAGAPAAPAPRPHAPLDKGKPQAKAAAPPPRRNRAGSPDVTAPAPQAASTPTSLFAQQPGAEGDEKLGARRVQVPVADALPGRAALERALKPFLRRRSSATRRVLDAEATAEASARVSAELLAGAPAGAPLVQALVPVLRPLAERWFDVALLAEQDEAMLVFEDTLLELRNLLAHHGAFAQVRLWRWSVQAGKVVVRSPSGLPSGPRAMLEAQRPQLALVLTHGASPHWEGAVLRKFVRSLGQRAVLAVVQMLPSPTWGFTALGEASERVRGRERGAPNRLLQRLDPWTGLFKDRAGADTAPMFALDAQGLGDWALWVMAPRLLEHGAVSLAVAEPVPQAVPVPVPSRVPQAVSQPVLPPEPLSPREQVLRFRAIASEPAFALLRLLAASWITLPVMRLLLRGLPEPRSAATLAEVLLSGLLLRQSAPDAAAQDMVFEFVPGVREWLHGALSSGEQREASEAMAATREDIRKFVEEKTGRKLANFTALLLDPQGTEFLPASARSFVDVSRRLHGLRGEGANLPRPSRGGIAQGQQAGGGLHNFPPDVRDLVPRPSLEDALAKQILAHPEGKTLLLHARPGAGARTLLARVLRRPAMRRRFGGGIWFGADPPQRGTADTAGLRLALRFGAKARGGDVRVELRWQREGEPDIGYLSPAEAAEYLRSTGLAAEVLGRLWAVHKGVPPLVQMVAVGAALGVKRWPSAPNPRPEESYGVIAHRVMQSLPPAQRQGLLEMSVRRPGFVGTALPGAELAPRLGWLCPGEAGRADTLHPSVARWMQTWYPAEVVGAHAAVLQSLRARSQQPEWAAYVQLHLLHHAQAAGGAAEVRRALFDRRFMRLLLQGDRGALVRELGPLSKKDDGLRGVLAQLQTGRGADELLDDARRPLMPEPEWHRRIELASAHSAGLSGNGVRVAIVSTGVDAAHPELQHLRIDGAIGDPNGHGTAVASIIAGCFVGVAPHVQLQSLAPMDADGSGPSPEFVKVFHALLAAPAEARPDIVCLAFGSAAVDGTMAKPLQRMLDKGMLLVAAAGNEGGGGLSFPASMPGVLSVGALTGTGKPAGFNNRTPDLLAPGDDMLVAQPTTADHGPVGKRRAAAKTDSLYPAPYGVQRGTSHACAVVAGLAALYAQATGLRGEALRDVLLRARTSEGHARFDLRHTTVLPAFGRSPPEPALATPAPAAPDANALQRALKAEAGKDLVIVRIGGGPELVLHPVTAKELIEGGAGGKKGASGGPSLNQVQVSGIDVVRASRPNDPAALAASRVVHSVDAQVDAGLYMLRRDTLRPLKGSGTRLTQLPASDSRSPLLIFIHGSFVDTAMTFGALWSQHPQQVSRLFDAFDDRIFALEHPTLGTRAVANAITLVQALPQGTRLCLATHGSGGVVAEVLARVAAWPSTPTASDLAPFSDTSDAPGHTQQRAEILDLAELMHAKKVQIDRVVRVACPSRGTLFASKRLDAYLSVLKWSLELAGIPVVPTFVDLISEVARRRAEPEVLPGLAELIPESPLLRWLHAAPEPVPGDLRVLAGNLVGDTTAAWVKTLMSDTFYRTDNDLILQTDSMYGGVPRAESALCLLEQGPRATHFGYFANPLTAESFVDAILLDEPASFRPIGPLSWAGKDASGVR